VRTTRQIYESIKNGDSVTTDELIAIREVLMRVSKDLYELGPTFRLAAREAITTANTVDIYITARMKYNS
jgi:hypothetical protein